MNLIVMAHKREARHLFSNYTLKKHPSIANLYIHDNFILFICGMGPILSHDRLLNLLTNYTDIKTIINLGICGAINQSLKLFSIYPIKTCIDAKGNPVDIQTPQGVYTCYTSNIKILTPDDTQNFSNIDLVDMEACGLSQASKKFNIPFHSYKLISDFPTQISDNEKIKSNFDTFSKQIFNFFKNHII